MDAYKNVHHNHALNQRGQGTLAFGTVAFAFDDGKELPDAIAYLATRCATRNE
jgi:hypothetical protein